jgi:hypothetical protein
VSRTIVSRVIAGCEVTGKLHRDVEERCCEHPAAASPFCPQCGKPMYRTVRQSIESYHDGYEELVINGKRWKVISDAHKRYFAGVLLAELAAYKDETVTRVESMTDEALEKLRAALTSIGLWDPAAYAIWSVLYAS